MVSAFDFFSEAFSKLKESFTSQECESRCSRRTRTPLFIQHFLDWPILTSLAEIFFAQQVPESSLPPGLSGSDKKKPKYGWIQGEMKKVQAWEGVIRDWI